MDFITEFAQEGEFAFWVQAVSTLVVEPGNSMLSNNFELSTERMIAHYKKCTGMTEKKIRELLLPAEDVWLSAYEAVKYGIADKIKEVY